MIGEGISVKWIWASAGSCNPLNSGTMNFNRIAADNAVAYPAARK